MNAPRMSDAAKFINSPVTEMAWKSHVKPFRLARDASITGRELLEATGLPKPWPAFIQRILDIADELELRVRCTPCPRMLSQWNGISSSYLFDTGRLLKKDGALAIPKHRLFSDIMDVKAFCLYKVVHETAHRIISEIGLRGMLRSIDSGHSAATPAWNFHVFGEMFAEFVSHYELGVATFDYWNKVWRPIAERSEGQSANVGKAAERAGLSRAQQRAILIFSAYFSEIEDPRPLKMRQIAKNAELAAVWTTERSYGLKSRQVSRVWWEEYWSHPAIRSSAQQFVPDGPSPIWLAERRGSKPKMLELRSLDELAACFDKVFANWVSPPEPLASQLRARRILQNHALSVCQVQRLLETGKIREAGFTTGTLSRIVSDARNRLFEGFQRVQGTGLGSVSRKSSREIQAGADRVIEDLINALRSQTDGDLVFFAHPITQGLDMSDLKQQLDLSALKDTAWPSDPSEQSTRLEHVELILNRLVADLTDVIRISEGGSPTGTKEALLGASALALEASLLNLEPQRRHEGSALMKRIRDWFTAAVSSNSIALCYRWSWISEMPYVDPLVGFRIT